MKSILVGLDGSPASDRALAHAKALAGLVGDCELILAYVIEWSQYSFLTPEEIEERHQVRDKELIKAKTRMVDPLVEKLTAEGVKVSAVIKHGDPAVLLSEIAAETGAEQILIGRTGHSSLRERIFGGVPGKLIMTASVPVTIIP
jgi:nucleotide-binding universal stress UspA family protein